MPKQEESEQPLSKVDNLWPLDRIELAKRLWDRKPPDGWLLDAGIPMLDEN